MSLIQSFCEVLRGLKRGRPALKICPKCRSPKLSLSSRFDIWLTPEQYICKNCGYKGPIVMEIEEEKKTRAL